MTREERLVTAVCVMVLMSIAFSSSLHSIGTGISLGICMALPFWLFDSEGDDDE